MTTTIKITPVNGTQQTLRSYEQCTVNLSATDRAGSFSLSFKDTGSNLVDLFPIGSDVQIIQDDHTFRGWMLNPSKMLNGPIRGFTMDGPDYTARTQKIVVTETFTDTAIDAIVSYLITNYVPWATAVKVDACPKTITIKFADQFLWDAMETLCKISGYEWYIDELLQVNFFAPSTRVNPNALSQSAGNYKRGSANLKPDSSKLVNKLWVKGGKSLSDDFTQNITVSGTTPIQLFYTPRATTDGVVVTIGGSTKTLGIQNVDQPGTKDFLLNFNEKLLIPDLCSSGTGTIVYRYEYPIKFLLEEPNSQKQYGVFEDIYKVETDDRDIALDLGLTYLAKYSQPVISGSIEPFEGSYRPGELLQATIPDLNVDMQLQVKTVTYNSVPGKPIERKLQLESLTRDLPSVLKDLNQRLSKLEKQVYQDDEGPVERYISRDEAWGWSETVTEYVWACQVPSTTLYPSDALYPC